MERKEYKIKLDGETYTFNGYADMSVSDFEEAANQFRQKGNNGLLTMLVLLFGIPLETIAKIHLPSLANAEFSELLDEKVGVYKLKENYKFGKMPDLDVFTFGEFADAEHFFTMKGDGRLSAFVAQLLNPESSVKQHALITEQVMDNMKMGDALAIHNRYLEFRTGIFDVYEALFAETQKQEDEEEGDEEEEQVGWGWLGAMYQLANDDITKVDEVKAMPLIKCLNFMSYRKEENEKLKAEMEKAHN